MKDKFSDNTLNTDNLSERNQEPTEKGKIKLLDVVALTQDVPEHNLKRGEVGTVVEILLNGEAYEVEFSDDNGQMSKCLSFLASQLRVLHQEPNADFKRQAHASIKGYLYQILHSVNAWLDLAEDETLSLEGVEDFDIISENTITAVQVKDTQRNITLKSNEALNAINRYWESQTRNPDRRVKFRFLTRSKIGKERGNLFGTDKPGLEVWRRCSGDEEIIKRISEFLQNEETISDEVKKFLKQTSLQQIYKRLIESITWETGSKDANSVKQSISDKLVRHGNKLGLLPFDASKVLDALLNEAFKVATHKGNRKLTKERFFKIFQEETTERVSTQHLRHLQMLATQTARDNTASVVPTDDLSDVTIQSYSPIQTVIPPLYPNVFWRTDLLTSIQTKLQSDGIVVIQGGVDKGKTTLAKLTANSIDGACSWWSFTNKDSSHIVQDLQRLAIAVSNQSAQVNVVLDDLNLQPQELRGYEEILVIVIYGILGRGAKLLITSQHNPPPNFIRSLGVSSSVTINVPNFTEPEIRQFAEEMGCPANDIDTWVILIQARTGGHPRLVHAWLVRLREEGWDEQNIIPNILQPPEEVVAEREAARQLLADLPKDRREFLYRLSLMPTGFIRKDYALNVAEIPEPILHPGDVFSQLVGPWIDQVSETYYTVSPLLTNAAKEVWSESRIKDLHAYIANAILKTKNLSITEVWAVLTHCMIGQNRGGFISVIYALMAAQEDDWENLCQEFSWLVSIKTDPPEELFPCDAFVNQMFRSLQYRIAVEVRPELVPKILEIWDKETKPYEPRKSYLLSRLMLATEILKYNQVLLPVKKMVGYLREMIDIRDNDKEVWERFHNSMGQLEGHKTEKSNFFSVLFGFIYARRPMYAPFLNELVDALDELQPEIRTLLLADFEDDTIDSRVLIDGIWLSEADLENPDWTRCLQIFDKVIEKTLAWGYPHLAAAAARGKATICDEYLNESDTAYKVLQDFVSRVGPSPIIEEQQAVIYLHQERYKEALNIYERILPKWDPPSGQLDVMPSVACRRAAICAAYLGDWKKAAAFFEEGAKRTDKTVNAERYVGFYADAGFAHFKAGNMFNCIKLLHQALQNFETLPQDNTNITYFTLKKRLEHTIKWIKTIWYESGDNTAELFEPSVGFCSDPETNEKVLDLPDSPIGYAWLHLSQIEYRFGHETTVFQHALQTTDREEYPILNFFLSFLEAQYEFRNKTFDNLPQRIYQLALVYRTSKKHQQSGRGAAEKGSYSISDSDLSDFTSVENITTILVASLLVQLPTGPVDTHEILTIWRANSSELSIKKNMTTALKLIDAMLSGDENNALIVMKTQKTKPEEKLTAALKIVYSSKTSPENLFHAHALITPYLIDSLIWLYPFLTGLADLLSVQWLEKIKFRATLKMPMLTVPNIEQACRSSETGKKKIGQVLLAAHQAVSIKVAPETLQLFRSWAESESEPKQGPAPRKNSAAQRLIKAMERPPHLTDEDIEALNRSIKEGEIPIKFDSPFDSDESNK